MKEGNGITSLLWSGCIISWSISRLSQEIKASLILALVVVRPFLSRCVSFLDYEEEQVLRAEDDALESVADGAYQIQPLLDIYKNRYAQDIRKLAQL